MKDVNFDAPQPVHGSTAENESFSRTAQLEQLYFDSFTTLRDASYEQYRELLVWDCDKILAGLSDQFHKYKGPPTAVAFEKWAVRQVKRESLRYKLTYNILAEHSRLIHKAIHQSLWSSATDAAIQHSDIFQEISALIFCKAHALNRRGTAKLTTRLFSLVETHCRLYHNKKNARRKALIQSRIADGLPVCREQLSEAELAAMRPEASAYDPGYVEAGLSLT